MDVYKRQEESKGSLFKIRDWGSEDSEDIKEGGGGRGLW